MVAAVEVILNLEAILEILLYSILHMKKNNKIYGVKSKMSKLP